MAEGAARGGTTHHRAGCTGRASLDAKGGADGKEGHVGCVDTTGAERNSKRLAILA
jgi:hypothetical protein